MLNTLSGELLNKVQHLNVEVIKGHTKANPVKATVGVLSGLLGFRWILLKLWRKINGYPPGPEGLPIMGYLGVNILYVLYGKTARKQLTRKYGSIYYYYGFGNNAVWISSSNLAKKVLTLKPTSKNKGHILSRGLKETSFLVFSNHFGETRPFSAINYDEWVPRRKLAHEALFSMCTTSFVDDVVNGLMKETIFIELNKIIDKNELWYPSKLMNYAAFNTIFHASFGYSAKLDDDLGVKLRQSIDDTFRNFSAAMIWNSLTFLRIFGKYFYPQKAYDIRKIRCELTRECINKRINEYDLDNNEPVSFIDHMLIAQKKGLLTRNQMEADIGTLFAAGTDTTGSTLECIIVYASKYTDIQDLVRNELVQIFGKNGAFSTKKVKDLPIFRAFIKEIQRIVNVAQSGLQHRANRNIYITDDDTGKTYFIKKGTTVNYNIDNIHYNINKSENWKDASNDKIILSNWIDGDYINDYNKCKYIANKSEFTFGYGPRNCVGLTLAMKELYIIIGNLLLNYKFSLKDPNTQIKGTSRGVARISPSIGVVITKL